MIERAKRIAGDAGLTNVEFAHTTIYDDSHLPGSFDAIL
jgi:hypothetical protein